ncbi:YfhO family protein, partial [Patescibacteria group bacterium]|nr:YfhO family protein [Patescibacteria group bacterium]
MKFSAIKRHVLVILLFIVLTVIMTYPLAGHLNNWVHDGADSYFITWTLAWDVHSLQEDVANIFNANIFYPNENTLAYSEHIIGTAVLAWPIIALTSNPILAYNLVTLLFFVLAGYCMYLFLYYLTKNSAVSIIGAIIFGFNPFRVVHFSQIHLQVIFFFPLMLLILHRLVDSKKNRNFIYLIIAYISLGYMSSHYFLMMAIVIATFIIFYFAAIKKRFPERQFVVKFILSLLVVFLAVFPVLYPYLLVHDEGGYVRSYGLVEYYSPDIVDYLAFSPSIAEIIGNP